ncbi:ZC11A [Enterospora canceri]|uniref:ZC11A n=1 Tax=Enterospora canceri TaxID=1081671 RepID=A0A1Y1S5K9_9MICR|nr:ZC11A [Enterospora canceri]
MRTKKLPRRKQNKLDKIEDCYYFLYSTCQRGQECGFRHNLLSKQCNILCDEWDRTGSCREECPLRHSRYHLKKSRVDEMCYWENHGGCKKRFCEFKHENEEKDEWKRGEIQDLNEVRREKNEIVAETQVDPEEFETERRKKRRAKIENSKIKKAKQIMARKLKRDMKGMDAGTRLNFERVLNLIEGKKSEDDDDAELRELEDLCK